MRPNEQNLERLLKKQIKQEKVAAPDLLFHWNGLGRAGDRIVIQTLNKMNGWESFLFWSESEPSILSKLREISERAGISEAGVLALKGAGLIAEEGETSRSQSFWILQTVRSKESGTDLDRAASILFQDPDFFQGTLNLLEMEESVAVAQFLMKLTEKPLTRDQDQAIRKALYRMRQKGIDVAQKKSPAVTIQAPERMEIFLFAENRMPLWQPFFYFRSRGGARGDWFFAQIHEGSLFEIVRQERDVRMSRKTMQRVADNYSEAMHRDTGVRVSYVSVLPANARHFLEKSFRLLRGSEDFQRYIGEAPIEDPTIEWQVNEDLAMPDAATLLSHEYFQLWMAPEEFLDAVFKRMDEIEKGPIILPEQQQREQKAHALDELMKEHFSGEKQSVWALTLEKAAYFLRHVNGELAAVSLGFARRLSNPEYKGESDPFIQLLVERSMQIRSRQIERREEEEKRSSLIMTPQEFEKNLTQRRREAEKKS